MNVLEQLLKDNADVCDTRHDMLTAVEVSAIMNALYFEAEISRMMLKAYVKPTEDSL